MRRLLVSLGLAARLLLALLLGFVAMLAWVLGTQGGGRWLLDQWPGVEAEGFEGELAGSWRVRSLTVVFADYRVHAQALGVAWSPFCLLGGRICIDQLAFEALDLNLPAGSGSADEGPIRLPAIFLPLALEVADLNAGAIDLNGDQLLESGHLAGRLTGADLVIDQLRLVRPDVSLQLSGRFRTLGDWPSRFRGHLELPGQTPWRFVFEAEGPLEKSVEASLDFAGPVSGQARGQVRLLETGLPVRLSGRIDRYPLGGLLPPALIPAPIQLSAEGDLNAGWRLSAQSVLPTPEMMTPVHLDGHLTLEELTLDPLLLTAGKGSTLSARGRVGWAEELRVELELLGQAFPWHRLAPGMADLPGRLRRVQAAVRWQNGRYQGHMALNHESEAGPVRLTTDYQGTETEVNLTGLRLDTGQGNATGETRIHFLPEGGLGWVADLKLDGANPAFLHPALEGALGGRIESRGQWQNGEADLRASWQLDGRLRQVPARLVGELSWRGNQWQASRLDLRLGDNRLAGRIGRQADWQADLQFSLTALQQLWPDLAGQLDGQVRLAGLGRDSRGHLELAGKGLAWEAYRVGDLQAELTRPEGREATGRLRASGLAWDHQHLESLALDLSGDWSEHRLHMLADHRRADLDMTFTGAWKPGKGWRGYWQAGSLEALGRIVRLADSASLAIGPDLTTRLGPHCLQVDEGRVCGEQASLYPGVNLDYTISGIPTHLFQEFFPPGVSWQSRADGRLNLNWADPGPEGRLILELEPGEVHYTPTGPDEEPRGYTYDSLAASLDFSPGLIRAQGHLAGPAIGRMELEARLNPDEKPRNLQGKVQLEAFELATLMPWLPVNRLAGELQGEASLEGTLESPSLAGQLHLENGAISDPRWPLAIEEGAVTIAFDRQGARFEGTWASGAEGKGRLEGRAHWGETLQGSLRISGKDIPARIEPYAQLFLEPDLQLSLKGTQLALEGTLGIPRGSIEVKRLPLEAVRVSEDAVVEGMETGASPGLGYQLDIDVPVGRKSLQFAGFGVTGKLKGRLRVLGENNTQGELTLVDGKYEFFGQTLDIRKAQLQFAGPPDNPWLNIEAVRQVEDVTAGVRISGRLDNPVTTTFSEPPLGQDQTLSYLILGRPLGGQADSRMMEKAALSLGLMTTAGLTRKVGETVGIKDLELSAEGEGQASKLVASGYLTDKLSVRYGMGLFQPASQVALRYDISRNLVLEAASGLASSLDLLYRTRLGDRGMGDETDPDSPPEQPDNQ